MSKLYQCACGHTVTDDNKANHCACHIYIKDFNKAVHSDKILEHLNRCHAELYLTAMPTYVLDGENVVPCYSETFEATAALIKEAITDRMNTIRDSIFECVE